ncbi:MAG: hypothetical protein N2050_11445 [Flavobacteriales bacterium]|nr:hypothetical protein [Flavobacteriales bacterium]
MRAAWILYCIFSAFGLGGLWGWGCLGRSPEPMAKPKGFPRIQLPEKKFQPLPISCPFTFLTPQYADVELHKDLRHPCWFNLKFRTLKATLFCTYENPGKDLAQYIEDSRTLAYKHLTKATGIREQEVSDPKARVFGKIYYIDGDVASACQFYLTDSVRHFLRGSLYFDLHTDPDSVAPVRQFLIQDIHTVTETLQWL